MGLLTKWVYHYAETRTDSYVNSASTFLVCSQACTRLLGKRRFLWEVGAIRTYSENARPGYLHARELVTIVVLSSSA